MQRVPASRADRSTGASKSRPAPSGPNGRGGPDPAPSAPFQLPRRGFLALLSCVALGCGGGSAAPAPGPGATPTAQRDVAYRLSTRGRRTSRAARAHAANKRFVSPEAAEAGRAHPGDRSRVVSIDIAPAQWDAWFASGAPVVDLRRS